VENVYLYDEKIALYFLIPDVPDTFRPATHKCTHLPKKVCDVVTPITELNRKGFQMISLLNKILTKKGLSAKPLTVSSVPDDLFNVTKRNEIPIEFPSDEIAQQIQSFLHGRNIRGKTN